MNAEPARSRAVPVFDRDPVPTLRTGRRPKDAPPLPSTCRLAGCEKPRLTGGRGWCNAHYTRWRRTGKAGSPQLQEKQPGALCSDPECDRPAKSRGMCHRHYTRARRAPGWERVQQPSVVGAAVGGRWTGDDASYEAVHFRIKNQRGPARAYGCVSCDRPAVDWAYDHGDPDERVSPAGLVYSLDMDRYRPMCKLCHKRVDVPLMMQRRRQAEDGAT